MNKYQEALNNVKTAPSFMGGNIKYKSNIQSSIPFLEHIAILQELVDKETPMKPIRKGRLNWWHCPKCNISLLFEKQPRCQEDCGQKLDWSGTNDI